MRPDTQAPAAGLVHAASGRSIPCQHLQNPSTWPSRRLQSGLFLRLLDRRRSERTHAPVGLALVEALRDQELLQALALGSGEAWIIGRPCGREVAFALQAIGEMRDRERVGFGRIVGIERVEIARHEEGRTSLARWTDQAIGTRLRKRRAFGARETAPGPYTDRGFALAAGGALI